MIKYHELKNHTIICGYGIVGEKIAEILKERNIPFVIIDSDQKVIEKAEAQEIKAIYGDATGSKTLKEAAIEFAKTIAIVMDDDAKNLLTTLTARDLNRDIFIATRANSDFAREKLIEGGANYIVMPQKVASKEILKEIFKEFKEKK
ncbi:MAG: NAD-binding protein [Candidatus Micrarchaeia archaeon]